MKRLTFKFKNGDKISARFRIINISLFVIVSALIVTVMFFVLQNITDTVSKDYARLYSSSTVGTINSYLRGEIALISKAANSKAVTSWFSDELNAEKKQAAYEEMTDIMNVLSGNNLYFGIEKSRHEFSIEEGFSVNDIKPSATLQSGYTKDDWYFECTTSDKDYLLNVDIDKILNRKLVWLNYKVSRDNVILGALCTGLEFSGLVERLFADYDNKSVRGMVIDEKGIIHMDSLLLKDDDFLHETGREEYHIKYECSDPAFISAYNAYKEKIDGYFDYESDTAVIELSTRQYQYATIAPIAYTTWSVVTFYNSSSLFNMTKLMPLFGIIFSLFLVFILATSFTSNKLIFVPFEKLMKSIEHTKTNMNERVYGTNRTDEIGALANTVQDMKDSLIVALEKAHYDSLTGIYNRRFLDENLSRIIKSISRSGGMLSVMLIDLDYFKKYNDTYGHSMGDACLKEIANSIADSITRQDDFVARFGGEEFIVVLPNTDKGGSINIANRILENVRACNIPHKTSGAASHVTVSIGVTTGYVEYTQSGKDYIQQADKALYTSKQTGRNKYTFVNFEESKHG